MSNKSANNTSPRTSDLLGPVTAIFIVVLAVAALAVVLGSGSAQSLLIRLAPFAAAFAWSVLLLKRTSLRSATVANDVALVAFVGLIALSVLQKSSYGFAAIALGATLAAWDLASLIITLRACASGRSDYTMGHVRIHLHRLALVVVAGVLTTLAISGVSFRPTFRWVALFAIVATVLLRKLIRGYR
jgi:hypothetical protein